VFLQDTTNAQATYSTVDESCVHMWLWAIPANNEYMYDVITLNTFRLSMHNAICALFPLACTHEPGRYK